MVEGPLSRSPGMYVQGRGRTAHRGMTVRRVAQMPADPCRSVGRPGLGGCRGAGLVKCSRVASAVGAMSRAMGGAVVEVVGLEVRVRRVHRATRRGGPGGRVCHGALEHSGRQRSLWQWTSGTGLAKGRSAHRGYRAGVVYTKQGGGEAAGDAVWNLWSRNPDELAMVGSRRGRSPVGSGAGAGPRGSRSSSRGGWFHAGKGLEQDVEQGP